MGNSTQRNLMPYSKRLNYSDVIEGFQQDYVLCELDVRDCKVRWVSVFYKTSRYEMQKPSLQVQRSY